MMAFKFFSSSKMSKTGKNVKSPLYIRYNFKIRYIKKVKIDFQSTGSISVSLQPLTTVTDDYFQVYMLSTFPCIEIPSSIEKSIIQTAVPLKVLGIRANPWNPVMRQLFSLMCQNLSSEGPKSKNKNFQNHRQPFQAFSYVLLRQTVREPPGGKKKFFEKNRELMTKKRDGPPIRVNCWG